MSKILFLILLPVSFGIAIWSKSNISLGINIVILLAATYGRLKGHEFDELVDKGWTNAKKSFIVVKIFILVGIISSVWIVSGTIPGIVYYGIKFINPKYFYLCAFVVTSIMSFLIGSSFGTVSTIGIAMIAVGRGLNADIGILGGAIMSGAYFGDRCSPVSSSANLVGTLTETNIYVNIKNMIKTGTVPFIFAGGMYVLISNKVSGHFGENILSRELLETFNLSFFVFFPVLAILICAVFKVDVKISMSFSILLAILIGVFFQKATFSLIIKILFDGYHLKRDTVLSEVIKGGGVISMWKPAYIVFVSCFLSGLLEKIQLFGFLKKKLKKSKNRVFLYLNTLFVAAITASFGCNQSIAVVMTVDVMKDIYKENKITKEEFALEVENSAIILPALIPWNIASYIPAMVILELNTLRYIPYSFYLYFIPIYILITKIFFNKTFRRTSNEF